MQANEQVPAAGLDVPDGVGFWAWEDGHNKGVSEVLEGFYKELIVDEEPGGLTPDDYSGRKWYRLHMPWETDPAQPHSAGVPEPVQEAIAMLVLHAQHGRFEPEDILPCADTVGEWLQSQRPGAPGEGE